MSLSELHYRQYSAFNSELATLRHMARLCRTTLLYQPGAFDRRRNALREAMRLRLHLRALRGKL